MNTALDIFVQKLAEEVDGIAVRALLRDFFQNADHGSPDAISKAGCLALAILSNRVGGKEKGHVLWNAWRTAWDSGKSPDYQNGVDFSGIDFRVLETNSPINFSRFQFGNHANFSGAHLGNFVSFSGAQWGDWANFSGAQWGDWVSFSRAQWGEYADFRGAQWGGGANFSACAWEQLSTVYGDDAAFAAAKAWAVNKGCAPDQFLSVDFSGTRFSGAVTFAGRKFKGKTSFAALPDGFVRLLAQRNAAENAAEGGAAGEAPAQGGAARWDEQGRLMWEPDEDQGKATVFTVAPEFHGCELHQDTTFDAAVFPKASGNEAAARAYRTLKLAFSKQQAIKEEQDFFRRELNEERLREKSRLRRWAFCLN